jgi:multicomponent K+:H+ antiporter subunit D
MNHWIIAPILLPAFIAPLIILSARHHLPLARALSGLSVAAVLAVAIGLVATAQAGPPQVYELGDWPAPFGIVLVLDRLSAAMVLLTSVLAAVVAAYAMGGLDTRGRHFHALFQFQILGLNGAFLTGDFFNLFVFFEVLLIASYGLMLHGAGAERLRAGLQYVVINLAGSALFLVSVAILYGAAGTLNMADLAVRSAAAPPGDRALLTAGGLLLLVVFALKAAIVPLHFWLPRTYAAAAAPVAALFAIMTKVGAYSILRMGSLMFGDHADPGAWAPAPWLFWGGLVTLAVGTLGVVAARDLRGLAAFSVVASMGTLLAAASVFTEAGAGATLYYLVHSTLTAAALFLTADLVAQRRQRHGDTLEPAPMFAHQDCIAALFLAAAVAMVGLPPLSGFLGKLAILQAVAAAPQGPWIWTFVLGTSALMIVAFARAGSLLFWRSAGEAGLIETRPAQRPAWLIGVAAAPLAGLVALSVAAAPVMTYLDEAAGQLLAPQPYIDAVLGPRSAATAP